MLLALLYIYSCESFKINVGKGRGTLRANMVSKTRAVGIERTLSEYTSQAGPRRVSGYVKFLLEDFHVHEIDPEGRVLSLGSFVPMHQVRRALENKRRAETGQAYLSRFERGRLDYPRDLLTEKDGERLEELLAALAGILSAGPAKGDLPHALLVCRESQCMKEARKRVHQWVRSALPFLETRTVDLRGVQEGGQEHLGSCPDFAALAPDHSLIHVAPNRLCAKLLTGKGRVEEPCTVQELQDPQFICDSELALDSEHAVEAEGPVEPELRVEAEPSNEPELPEEGEVEAGPSLEEILRSLDKTDYSTFNPKSYARFLHFNLLKINRETSEVVNMMCRLARRASFDFFAAGNKDKRGITVQRMCIRRCSIEDLLEAMARGRRDDVYLSDFSYRNARISLGDLSGNHFKIAIRGIEDASSVESAIEALRTNGFINYFGLQRFGTKIVGTHVIGAAIVDQRYELALRLILGDIESAKQFSVFNRHFGTLDAARLSQSFEGSGKTDGACRTEGSGKMEGSGRPEGSEAEPGEMKYRRAADHYLFDNDVETALKHLPGHLFVEKSVLRGLEKQLGFDKCLERVPKNILTIYVHSTQSLLFNLAATERLNRFGLRVVPGDLVVPGDGAVDASELSPEAEQGERKAKRRLQVLEVNSEEEAGRYSIEQVVLPLPGDNITYPRNMEDFYRRASLESFGIPLEHFSTLRSAEGRSSRCIVSVGGSYRFIVVKPRDVTYRLIGRLEDPLEVLIRPGIAEYEPDLERRENARNLERIYRLAEQMRNKAALLLTCSLPKSSYVTVALREILSDESMESSHG